MENKNLFSLPPLPLSEELTDVFIQNDTVRIERFVSTGQTSGWYDQAEWEFVTLLQGQAQLEYANSNTITMNAGDTVTISPHERHRVAYTSAEPACIWLCVFWR